MPQTENLEKAQAEQSTEQTAEKTDEAPEPRVDPRTREAEHVVKNHVIGAMGASLVPIPLVDMIALSGIQLKMLHSLARLYRVPFSKNVGKKLIASLVGGVVPTSVGITVASFAKAVPGMGTATGIISVSALGGATTYAIGSVFIKHFESGGTFLDFDPKKMQGYFTSKVKEGKDVATKLKKSDK